MSDFLQKATGKGDPWKEAREAAGYLENSFPSLAAVLLGDPQNGQNPGRIPGSVRIFTNAGALKACISGREWLFDGYLVIPKEVGIIEGIECELKAGRIGWSVASEQKNSSKKPTY